MKGRSLRADLPFYFPIAQMRKSERVSRYNLSMSTLREIEPVDYLAIGHVAHDLTPDGWRLGGTAAYSALTARALGLRVGIVTASGPETSLASLLDIPVVSIESPGSTTFENIYTPQGRIQYLRGQATRIDFSHVPPAWRSASIIHLGPIANEMDATLPGGFAPTLLGLTPQGWMRQWDSECRVSAAVWQGADVALAQAAAVESHLDWYEANHTRSLSHAFDDFLELDEQLEKDRLPRNDSLSKALDHAQKEFEQR